MKNLLSGLTLAFAFVASAASSAPLPLLNPIPGGGVIVSGAPIQLPALLKDCGPVQSRMNPGSQDVGMVVYSCSKLKAEVRLDIDRTAALNADDFISNNIKGMQAQGLKPQLRFARRYATADGTPRSMRAIIVTLKDGKTTFGRFIDDRKDGSFILQVAVPGNDAALIDQLATALLAGTRFDAPANSPVLLSTSFATAMASVRDEMEAYEIERSDYIWRLKEASKIAAPNRTGSVSAFVLTRDGLRMESKASGFNRQILAFSAAIEQWQAAAPSAWAQAQSISKVSLATSEETGAAFANLVPAIKDGVPNTGALALYSVMKARSELYRAAQPGLQAQIDALSADVSLPIPKAEPAPSAGGAATPAPSLPPETPTAPNPSQP